MVDFSAYTLSLFAAACLGVFVAVVTWVAVSERTAAARLFIALNACTALWAATYFIQLTYMGDSEPAVQPIGSWGWALFLVMLVSISGTVMFWFLFAAAQAHRYWMLSGWPSWLAIAYASYTVAIGGTNALHGLFASDSGIGQPTVFGALAMPHFALSYVFTLWGLFLVVSDLWLRGKRRQRIAAGAIAVVILGGMAGSVLWSTQSSTGLEVPLHLTPVVMPAVTATLAWAALHAGLGGIAQLSASRSQHAMPEPAIAIDDRMVVLSMNQAAEGFIPRAAVGRRLDEFMPAASARATDALASTSGYRVFQHTHKGRIYWGRATCTHIGGSALGCILTLTDVTDAPEAKRELRRALGQEPDDDPVISVLSPDVRDLVDGG